MLKFINNQQGRKAHIVVYRLRNVGLIRIGN